MHPFKNIHHPSFNDDDKPTPEDKPLFDNTFSGREIEKKFIEQRRVFLWGVVDDKSSRDVVNKILYLEALDNTQPIRFFINSPGGIVTSGMVIYDVIKIIKSPVHTICMGLAASMGSILLSAGQKGHRYIFPHGEVMIHQPSISGIFQGTSADIQIQAEQIRKTKQLGAQILAHNCSKPIDQINKDFDRDYWMDAQESLAYGIVDKIIDKF